MSRRSARLNHLLAAIGSRTSRPVTTMKLGFLAPLCALVLVHPSPVFALDCAKASSPVDKLICATPELKKADEEMATTYFKLLRETADPEFHEALIQSQRRWLKVRSFGPDRFGQAENGKIDDREVLLKMTRDRLTFLRTAAPIRVMEQERKIMSKDGGGTFAGFKASCVLLPPPYGNWTYECWGDAHRQHKDRVCSSAVEWVSAGHMTEYRLVSILKDVELKLVATCSTGYTSEGEDCPDPNGDAKTNSASHWNTNPTRIGNLPNPHAHDFWKYDPDIELDQINQEWMHDCLFAPIYPPPEVSRLNSKSDASGTARNGGPGQFQT
jgi:uncharacterized protein YecT (DUF1311 family)